MNRTVTPSNSSITRRSFLAGATTLAADLIAEDLQAQETPAAPQPNNPHDNLNLAVVGAGGRGADDLDALSETGVNVIALCDCDWRQAADSFRRYPNAKRYTDWRKMFTAEKEIDAVLVATPDHNHAIVSIAAMKLGKHVYCEKPVAHSIWEARQMAKVAAEKGVATQMGTQGHAFEGTRRAVEVMRAGILGDVTELHVWTDRPSGWWPQGIARPTEKLPVPAELDWDVWLGPAPWRPYHSAYVPFRWRGFWDFGTGAIGDMGIHNLDTAFWGLQLGLPTSVEIKDCSSALTDPTRKETAPLWSILEFHFPARGKLPPVRMTWYDGGKLPPHDLFQGEKRISMDGGSLVIGTKGTLFTRTWHGGETADDMFVLLPHKQFDGMAMPAPTLPRPRSHHQEWVDACRGRGQSLSNFGYAAVLTEALLLGNLALRMGKRIEWDAHNMRARNCPEANAFIHPVFRAGWA
jgi:predicted dehydrogenase